MIRLPSVPAAFDKEDKMHACDQPTPEALYPFDARGVAKRFRHAAIFGALDSLMPGETMRFCNDHDPLPLLGQLAERAPIDIQYLVEEPGEWHLRITRKPLGVSV